MKLSKKSLSFRLWSWFYGIHEHRKNFHPKNLCPYFWQLVLMWVLLIPYSIACLPAILMYEVRPAAYYTNGDHGPIRRFFLSIAFSVVFFVCVSALISLWGWGYHFLIGPNMFSSYVKDGIPINNIKGFTFFVGTLTLLGIAVVSAGIALTLLINWAKGKIEDLLIEWKYREVKEEKKGWILTEFIKAKYNKYCPSIEWEEETNQTN